MIYLVKVYWYKDEEQYIKDNNYLTEYFVIKSNSQAHVRDKVLKYLDTIRHECCPKYTIHELDNIDELCFITRNNI